MGIMDQDLRLSTQVRYDDYDSLGFLLDIRNNVLYELNERDTYILTTILRCKTLPVALKELEMCPVPIGQIDKADIHALLERLREQKILEPLTVSARCEYPLLFQESKQKQEGEHRLAMRPVIFTQRLIGAGYIISVLNELRQGDEGLYKAYQYILHLRNLKPPILAPDLAFQRAREEYWSYRLALGLVEKRAAYLLGQGAGNEGLCLIRAFALCAYLIALRVSSQIVIGRPKYGSSDGFKLHSWAEINEKPLNERPNIRDAYRIMDVFPPCYNA